MTKKEIFEKLESNISDNISFLEDKPEETPESTLKALWLKASGISKSCAEAAKCDLPDLSNDQLDTLHKLINERISNTPLAHITGKQSFMGIEMLSDSRALIPRKETEILGNTAIKICTSLLPEKSEIVALDICCGSGNLGIALSIHIPKIKVFSSDLSTEAVELAKENIKWLNVEDRVTAKQGNLFEAFNSEIFWGKVDLIVCNPPYISSAKVTKMNAEISDNEPNLAFDGGMLGTKIIQQLIKEAPNFLISGGYLIFEVGLGQGSFIIDLCKKTGKYKEVSGINDSSNQIRVIKCSI